MTGAARGSIRPEIRLRAVVHAYSCGQEDYLPDTYDPTEVASFITAFAEKIAHNNSVGQPFSVIIKAHGATIPVKMGTFDELQWRNMLLNYDGTVQLQAVVSGPPNKIGDIEVRYSFSPVAPITP